MNPVLRLKYLDLQPGGRMNFRRTRICGTRGTRGRDRHPAEKPPNNLRLSNVTGSRPPDMTAAIGESDRPIIVSMVGLNPLDRVP